MSERSLKPNTSALLFIIAGAVWFVVGTSYGFFTATHLVSPELYENISFLVFGRARPIHVNTIVYGFVLNTSIGVGLYYTPVLLRTRLWSEGMGVTAFALWNLAVTSGPLGFSFGYTQGREYTEYEWIFDVSLTLSLLLLGLNAIMTILRRRVKALYVSIWYYTAAFLWTVPTYFIGNVMWRPETGALPGLIDSLFLWFWGHDLPGLLLTPLGVGAAYFVIPRITQRPLYSHLLSVMGFWTLVILYTHIGGHHVLQAPIPTWLKAASVIDSMAMIVPVVLALMNLWMSARRRFAAIYADPAGLYVMTGTFWYLLTCIQGPLQSVTTVQRITHFNNWTVGHAHIAILGFTGYIALGTLWHVLPLITGHALRHPRLIKLQFVLVTIGLSGFFTVLTAAGLVQGQSWDNGETVYRSIPTVFPYMVLRAGFGVLIITASMIGLYVLVQNLRERGAERPPEEGAGP